ncbi:MAG: ComEC/Rec2 family competence protein [Clostridia bacterium]
MASLAFLAGCIFAVNLDAGLWLWVLCLFGAALFLLLRLLGKRAAYALLLCVFALGVLRAQASLSPTQPLPGEYEITGYVYGQAKPRAADRIGFTLTEVSLNGQRQKGKAYCSVYWKDTPPALYDGAQLRFTGRVYLPEGKSGAPHSDFRLWMLQNGMTFGITTSKKLQFENTPQSAPWKNGAFRIQSALGAMLSKTMGTGAPLAMAMLLNNREGLADEEIKAFQTLGIAHIMSVSGMHVGLLGSLLMVLLNAIKLRKSAQIPIVGLFLMGYCALTGFSASSIRATVMLLFALLASRVGRMPDPLTTIAAAMLIVLLDDPLQAYSAGFVLSFSAVTSIALLMPVFVDAIDRAFPPKQREARAHRSWMRRFGDALMRHLGRPRDAFCLSLAAQIGVLLPTAITFHRLPLYGVFINLLLIPYVGLLIPLYFLALLFAPIPLLGMAIGTLAKGMGNGLQAAVSLLATLPYASIRVPSAPMLVVLGTVLCILIFSRFLRGKTLHRACAALLIAALMAGGAYAARPQKLRYIQLAVGQEDAALLFDGNQTIAIDVGSDGIAVADYLLSEGRDLDALYLTHLHPDHAAGVHYLLEQGIGIRQVYLPINAELQILHPSFLSVTEALSKAGIPMKELAAGDKLRYNEATVKVLWPKRETIRRFQDANDLPLVLCLDLKGYTLLSTSDLNGVYESYAAVPCDVLKVAHHGSAKSTGDDFLDFVRPRIALVSCSAGAKALPSPKTLDRLNAHGITLCRTDATGDITITIQGGQLCVTPYKVRSPK